MASHPYWSAAGVEPIVPRAARLISTRIRRLVVVGLGGLLCSPAIAETDEFARQIDAQRAAMGGLKRLDREGAAKAELLELRAWLDEALREQSTGAIERAEELLVRCQAQAELIRHLVESASLRARVQSRETHVEGLRRKIDRVRGALDEALTRKKALEEKLELRNQGHTDGGEGGS